MDFLDPRFRRKHRIYLMVGYVLMAILILLGTIVLVYSASGYGINTKTGDIIQNGLLFVDSKPGGAEIFLNGTDKQSTTSARLVLQAGNYSLTLKKEGYLDWQRTIKVRPQMVDRFVYPFLFPSQPLSARMKTYAALPPLVTQSPDRHWLLVQGASSTAGDVSFEVYDLTNPDKTPTPIALPGSILSKATEPGSRLSLVEWADDNRHVLLKRTYPGGNEFIILDRSKPESSVNLNKIFKINPSQITLRNKKANQVYIYRNNSLSLADVGRQTVATPLLTHVLAFKTNGADLVAYITDSGTPKGQMQARIWDGKRSYSLNEFKAGTAYLVDFTQYSGDWYYVVGSNTSDKILVYKNPLDQLRNASVGQAKAILDMHDSGATHVSFSDNARFIETEAGQKFSVYDLEEKELFRYTLKYPLTGVPDWMDGHRLIGESRGQILVMDFDSANLHLLAPTLLTAGGYFSPDYNQLYTFQPVSQSSQAVLTRIDMRAGNDLPASLRTP